MYDSAVVVVVRTLIHNAKERVVGVVELGTPGCQLLGVVRYQVIHLALLLYYTATHYNGLHEVNNEEDGAMTRRMG